MQTKYFLRFTLTETLKRPPSDNETKINRHPNLRASSFLQEPMWKTEIFIVRRAANHRPCGDSLPDECSSLPVQAAPEPELEPEAEQSTSKGNSRDQILMYSGYFLIGLLLLTLTCIWLWKRRKSQKEKVDADNKVAAFDDDSGIIYTNPSFTPVDFKKPEISGVSAETTLVSSSLIVLASPEVNGLKFDDLLKAPAELLGKGKHGTAYKVICEDRGMNLVVKRIKDWTIPNNIFKQRMRKLDQVKHPNVLPPVAFYCSSQEKLLVYEYQTNGSLFRLIHGTQKIQLFNWSSRLAVAAAIGDALAFMHQELFSDGIAHGNLKSSNVLLNSNMEPCISEYGLMANDIQEQHSIVIESDNSFEAPRASGAAAAAFKADIYGFGLILLELLTGKLVRNEGMSLARWVVSVIREEWTVEVFDKILIREGANEERLVNLLQVAIKCVSSCPEARPSMSQVALMINNIREDDDRSMDVSSGP